MKYNVPKGKREEAHIVYENEDVCCFLDKYPINIGHLLVVPKRHYEEFCDVHPSILAEIMAAAQKSAQSLEKLLRADGITIMQNNGIFKDVPHYHMHIIPRFKEDGFSWIEPDTEISDSDFEAIKTKLSNLLSD